MSKLSAEGRDMTAFAKAVTESISQLGLDAMSRAATLRRAEAVIGFNGSDPANTLDHVRHLRYLLVEVADGPIAAVLADAAERILDDGVGRLFS